MGLEYAGDIMALLLVLVAWVVLVVGAYWAVLAYAWWRGR